MYFLCIFQLRSLLNHRFHLSLTTSITHSLPDRLSGTFVCLFVPISKIKIAFLRSHKFNNSSYWIRRCLIKSTLSEGWKKSWKEVENQIKISLSLKWKFYEKKIVSLLIKKKRDEITQTHFRLIYRYFAISNLEWIYFFLRWNGEEFESFSILLQTFHIDDGMRW